MCIEDLTEEQAKKILDALAQKLGYLRFRASKLNVWSDIRHLGNSCWLESCDGEYDSQLYMEDKNSRRCFVFPCSSSSFVNKTALEAILDVSSLGYDIVVLKHGRLVSTEVFVKKQSSLEQIIIDLELLGSEALELKPGES